MANIFKNAKLLLTTAMQDIYTPAASTTAIIFSIEICNIDGANSADVTIEWEDNSDGSAMTDIMKTIPVPPDTTLAPLIKITLETLDSIRGMASANGDLEVTLAILEIT